MASLTLKGVPDDLLARLKREAAEQRRSLNGEVLHRLEKSVSDQASTEAALEEIRRYRVHPQGGPLTVGELKQLDARAWLEEVRKVRDKLDIHATTEEIIAARDSGRK